MAPRGVCVPPPHCCTGRPGILRAHCRNFWGAAPTLPGLCRVGFQCCLRETFALCSLGSRWRHLKASTCKLAPGWSTRRRGEEWGEGVWGARCRVLQQRPPACLPGASPELGGFQAALGEAQGGLCCTSCSGWFCCEAAWICWRPGRKGRTLRGLRRAGKSPGRLSRASPSLSVQISAPSENAAGETRIWEGLERGEGCS